MLRLGPSTSALRALDAIHDRLESPADRLLRHVGARSSYLVLPLFALANAGVVITPGVLDGRGMLLLAIVAGLALGKLLGLRGGSLPGGPIDSKGEAEIGPPACRRISRNSG